MTIQKEFARKIPKRKALYTLIASGILSFASLDAMAQTGNPRVNQLGYVPNGAKTATYKTTSTSAQTWQLKQNGNVVASGQTTPLGTDAASGDNLHQIDLSNVTATGTGFSLTVGSDSSYNFAISSNALSAALYDSLKYFYHNRSGIAIDTQYTGGGNGSFANNSKWSRPAGHINVGANKGDFNVPCWTGTCSYTLNVSKGWYDAGDHGKYVVNGGISVWTLLNLYERSLYLGKNSPSVSDGKLNIPESSNGIPDVLDEARWEMEFLLGMQVPAGQAKAGMVHHKMHDVGWTGFPLAPHEDSQQRALVPPSTAATLNLAATAAQAARIWRDLDSGFAATCLTAAERAWTAAQANPSDLYSGNYDNGGGGYGDKTVADEFYWAAAELYITTGDSKYLSTLNSRSITQTNFGWADTDLAGLISLAIVPASQTASLRSAAQQKIVSIADLHIATQNSSGYPAPSSTTDYYWGSNGSVANKLILMGLAYDFTKNDTYAKGVGKGLNFFFGQNTQSTSFITGEGTKAVTQPHHRFWSNATNSSYPTPPPGAFSGGPNAGLEDPKSAAALASCVSKPATCWMDHIEAYAVNEITINWNAPLAWNLAFYNDYAANGNTSSSSSLSSSSVRSSSSSVVSSSSSIRSSSSVVSSSSSVRSSSSIASSSSVRSSSSVASSSSSTNTSVGRLDNPFSGARWYVDPVWSAKAAAEPGGSAVASYNTAVWMDRIGAIEPTEGYGLRDHLDAAVAQNANVIQVVVYDLPNRDCKALASNGELKQSAEGSQRYRTEYVDKIASIFSDSKYASLRIIAIIEPDSLPNLVTNLNDPDCQAAADATYGYIANTRYTLSKLYTIPNVYSYVDIGHSGWLGWDDNFGKSVTLIADAIKGATGGVNSIAGFVSNTAGYTPLYEPFLDSLSNSAFPGSGGGTQTRQASFYEWNPYFSEVAFVQAWRTRMIAAGFPSSIGMLVDTSRNGWGGSGRPTAQSTSTVLDTFVDQSRIDKRTHRGNWCNQKGGIGERPQVAPAAGIDAYVWVKPPGESDGAASQELSYDPQDPAKGFDRQCDPTYTYSAGNSTVSTGAMANAPVAGRWFSSGFQLLLGNAYPAAVATSSSSRSSSSVVSSSSVRSSSSSVVSSSVVSSSSSVRSSSSIASSSSVRSSSSVASSSSSTNTSVGRLDNPFSGARWYVDPVWSAKAAAEPGGSAVASYNTAVWMDRIGAIEPTEGYGLRDHLDAAVAQNANVIQVVVYDLPNRDCKALASNGELKQSAEGSQRYRTEYVDKIASIFSDSKYASLRIIAIIEPDSLPNLVTNLNDPDCQAAADATYGYIANTRYTLSKLYTIPNVYSYVDIGHSGWLGWDDNFGKSVTLIADAIKGATGGVNSIAGFVSNTAGYTPLYEPFLDSLSNSAFPGSGGGTQTRQASFYEWNPYFSEVAFVQAWRTRMIAAGFPSSIGMLVDTSRNGWGGSGRPTAQSTSTVLDTFVDQSRIDKRTHRGNWCNQKGGIGERPQVAPAAGIDAYVWVKPPGESDGAASQELSYDPQDPAKGFDRQCDPTYTYAAGNSTVSTGAMANAPVAGRWFSSGFQLLLGNAYPAAVATSSSSRSSSSVVSSSSVRSSSSSVVSSSVVSSSSSVRSSSSIASSSSVRSSSSVASSSSSASGQQCNWYGQLYPLCVNNSNGWGYENNKSCIGRNTCAAQPAPYGIVGESSSSSSAANRAPVAAITYSQSQTCPQQSFTISGASSTDADGDALTYEWVVIGYGDPAAYSSVSFTTSLRPVTSYTVTLTVKDGKGGVSTATQALYHSASDNCGVSSSSSSIRSSSSSVVSSSSSVRSSSSSVVSSSSSVRSSSSSSVATNGAKCTYVVSNQWNNGFTGAIRITNNGTSAINGWNVSWSYSDGSKITSSWNANVSGSNPYSASGVNWNSTIQPGQTAEFGFQGTKGNSAAQTPTVTGSICQ